MGGTIRVGGRMGGTIGGSEVIGCRDGERDAVVETVREDGVEIVGVWSGCVEEIGNEDVIVVGDEVSEVTVGASVALRVRGLVCVGSRRLLANSSRSDALVSSLSV